MNRVNPTSLKKLTNTNYTSLMERRIKKILMICSGYDKYILEEDGQIESQLYVEYSELNLSNPPSFTWVSSSQDAIKLLQENSDFDLIISMYNLIDFDLFSYAPRIKALADNIPIVLLTNFSRELFKRLEETDHSYIDYIFSWHGNADLIMAIVKLIEDKMNAEEDIIHSGVRAILLVEDSIRYYSTYLPELYKLILNQSAEFVKEALNENQFKSIKRARPKIILATNFDDAKAAYQKYKDNLLGVISDVGFVEHKDDASKNEKLDAGIVLCKEIRKDRPFMPILLQSSQKDVAIVAKKMGVGFIEKYSKTLLIELEDYIAKEFAFGDFVARNLETGAEIARAKNLREMQVLIKEIPDRELIYYTSKNYLSKWFYSRGIFTLAVSMEKVKLEHFDSIPSVRKFILSQIQDYRVLSGQGIVARFEKNTYNRYIWFAKMGNGSLGGKARGLAFLNNIINKYELYSRYKGMNVGIPRSVAVASDYFDQFIKNNGLQYVINSDISDEEILGEFVASRLPARLVVELRKYLSTISSPLAVRSSSKLEDSHYQPFAGIYKTYMIPYSNNVDQMLRILGKAIKSVYASVYFSASRSYIQTTGNFISEEKMSVIIQSIVGTEDHGYYFPTMSGVARSLNFYPLGNEKPEDGIVNLAFGLGKAVVDGERTLRFSPRFPKKVMQLSSPRIALNETQNNMYVLDLRSEMFRTSVNDGVNLKKLSVQDVDKFRNLQYVASTWDMNNQRMVPNVSMPGQRIISFARVLEYNYYPVAQIITDLLAICKKELGSDVEIEFASNMDVKDGKPALFSILQVRPITQMKDVSIQNWDSIDISDPLIFSDSSLGFGVIEDVTDIIYIRNENFDKSKTYEIAEEIGRLNAEMKEQKRNYILVGPGRWGSSDKWLGIPVKWDQISEVKVIVECGLKDFNIDPSQGSHFFQNITSLGIGYMTINPFRDDGVFNEGKLKNLECDYESKFVRRVKFEKSPHVLLDGQNGKGVINFVE
ncbi:MAG: PEP/pyruvate-binding domain-containing protein [Bacteroidales bacterium]